MPSPKSFFEIVLSQSHSAIGLCALSYVGLLQPAASSHVVKVARLLPSHARSVRRSDGVWSQLLTGGAGASGWTISGASGVSCGLGSLLHAARSTTRSFFCMLSLCSLRA